VAAYGDRRTAFAGLAVTAVAIGIREAYDFPRATSENWVAAVFYLLPLLAFAAGLYVHSARESADHERRARSLERERDERALAVAEERVRIARELHDVVAHSVTATVVQAEAAEEVLATSPDSAAEALRNIQRTGRETLITMRGLVGIMRSHESPGALTPHPGVDEVPALVEDSASPDLRISLRVEGEPRQLPPGVDLSAYRIVQESLTNVRRHAGRPATALVTVRYEELWIELEVLDDGRPQPSSGVGGHGLIGMRERVAFFGGNLIARPRAETGFVVRARIPVGPVQS
jgi:signal transduction histidine kinase